LDWTIGWSILMQSSAKWFFLKCEQRLRISYWYLWKGGRIISFLRGITQKVYPPREVWFPILWTRNSLTRANIFPHRNGRESPPVHNKVVIGKFLYVPFWFHFGYCCNNNSFLESFIHEPFVQIILEFYTWRFLWTVTNQLLKQRCMTLVH
jgi:hypothetical protein